MEVLADLFGDYASLPARGAWIEIVPVSVLCFQTKSLPARGAWIEIAFAISFVQA